MMRELFSQEFDRSVRARRAEGVRYEQIVVDLNITMQTMHNWRHPKTANISLDKLDLVAG